MYHLIESTNYLFRFRNCYFDDFIRNGNKLETDLTL